MPSRVTVVNHFPDAAAALHQALHDTVAQFAGRVRDEYARGVPVDTGALQASPYVVMSDFSDYAETSASAASRNPHAKLAPEVARPDDPFTAIVSSAVEYALPVELGSVKAPAQPALVPAVERLREPYTRQLQNVVQQLRRLEVR